ncbi:MAG: hypothetical protein JNM69_27385 [Archangium sp.]|nr:hypothetical protein [Archangium sp.]
MHRFAILLLLIGCAPPAETIVEGRRVIVVPDAGSGRTDAGARDSGVFVVDGGLRLEDGGAVDLDSGVVVEGEDAGCPSDCTCTIRFDHSGGGAFISSIELPCCATLCLGGSDVAWTCHDNGRVTTHAATLVCRP